jgi:hypothetical protein
MDQHQVSSTVNPAYDPRTLFRAREKSLKNGALSPDKGMIVGHHAVFTEHLAG